MTSSSESTSALPLEVVDLVKTYRTAAGIVRAVDGVNLFVRRGESFGLVGESGSGKTTLARCVLRLVRPTSGAVLLDGEDIVPASSRRMRILRRRIQIVFQDPFSSLNPRMDVETLIAEGLVVHGLYPDGQARRRRVVELLELVGLAGVALQRHPHSFSGGQRQRIAIARALAVEPEILILDEPVSSLDVSMQAQILNLFVDLRHRLGLTILLISHDLAVVQYLCDRVAVMQAGRIVETADSRLLYSAPKHPYTKELLLATPVPDPELERRRRRDRASGDPGEFPKSS